MREADAELTVVFERVYREMGRPERSAQLQAVFYPFVTLRHTMRRRGATLHARISDILREAPEEILECIAHILLAKLYRRRIKEEHLNIYKAYAQDEPIRRRAEEVHRRRRKTLPTQATGRIFNLRRTFDRLNQQYFGGQLAVEHLTWTRGDTRRRLGYFDAGRNRIVISRSLDDVRVPAAVFEYVVFHEMLHLVHQRRLTHGRHCAHHADFLQDERQYPLYQEAQAFLRRWRPPFKRKLRRTQP